MVLFARSKIKIGTLKRNKKHPIKKVLYIAKATLFSTCVRLSGTTNIAGQKLIKNYRFRKSCSH